MRRINALLALVFGAALPLAAQTPRPTLTPAAQQVLGITTAARWVDLGGGLQRTTIASGTGAVVTTGGQGARVHYTGTFRDGRVFDSSRPRNTPFCVPLGLGQVIPGWDRGLVGLRAGARVVLAIPAALGYGAAGAGAVIPPNTDLFFEVEVLDPKATC